MRKYFIYDGHAEKGPLTLEELKSYSLKKETPVWYEGLEEWAMAGNLDELSDFFVKKITPPPLPTALKLDLKARDQILNSFGDAGELYPEPRKKSWLLPLVISIVVTAVILASLFFYRKYFK